VAALFRDGGLEAAAGFVVRFILPADLVASGDELFSSIISLRYQERLQAGRKSPAEYQVCGGDGARAPKNLHRGSADE